MQQFGASNIECRSADSHTTLLSDVELTSASTLTRVVSLLTCSSQEGFTVILVERGEGVDTKIISTSYVSSEKA